MTREDAYKVIDLEREYQDRKWGGAEHDRQHSVADWIIFMEIFLNKAKEELRVRGEAGALEKVVKVTALGVACMENYNDRQTSL
jgi:hypothetical protein